MKSINQVTLLGNVVRDVELRYTPNGDAVITFTIVTSRAWNDKTTGDKKEATEYTDVVFWRKAAEIINQFVKKGSRMLVQGRLQTRSWEKDGTKHYKTEVYGNDFIVFDKKIEKKETQSQEDDEAKPAEKEKNNEKINPDDIPF